MQFQASTIDNRNVGSKVTIPKEHTLVFGEIASIERHPGARTIQIALTDGLDVHEVDFDTWLDVQLSAAENAVIQTSSHIQALVRLVERIVTRQEK